MNFDHTSDFYLLDNLEPLSLQVAGRAAVPIAAGVSMPAEYAEADAAGGNVLQGDKVFAWPQNASPRPPLGALIVDGNGEAWTILAVAAKGDVKTWECHGRALAIVNRLDNSATLLTASYVKSAGGEALPEWRAVLANIPARFQSVEQEARILEDAEWPKTTYHVYLGVDIFVPDVPIEPASADYRLRDAAGRHYRLVRYQRPQRIDALPVAVCVLVIEGSEGGAADRVTGSSSGA